MKWLKKILGIKDRELSREVISIKDLDGWLEERTSRLRSELDEKIGSLYPKIKEVIGGVGEKIAILSEVDISERKVSERVKKIVVDNRDSYVRQVNSFVKNFVVPEKVGYAEAIIFHPLFTSKLDRLGRNSFRNLSLTSELIGEEAVAVNDGLKKLDELMKEVKSVISDEKIQGFYKVKRAIKELKNLRTVESRLGSEENRLLLKEKDAEKKVSVLRAKIVELKESKEHKEFGSHKEEVDKINQAIGSGDFQIRNLFGPLQKALQKLLQVNRDSPEERVLKEYVEDPVAALIKDEEFKIIGLLEDTKEALIEGRIYLKDKKKEQTLKVMKVINVNILRGFVERRKSLEMDKKVMNEKISAVDIMEKIADAQKEIYDLGSSIEGLDREVMKVNGRRERLSFDEIEKKIIAGIELVTNTRVGLSDK